MKTFSHLPSTALDWWLLVTPEVATRHPHVGPLICPAPSSLNPRKVLVHYSPIHPIKLLPQQKQHRTVFTLICVSIFCFWPASHLGGLPVCLSRDLPHNIISGLPKYPTKWPFQTQRTQFIHDLPSIPCQKHITTQEAHYRANPSTQVFQTQSEANETNGRDRTGPAAENQ